MKITGRDIAEQIAKTPEALPSAMERVRHWTREGLLEIVGDPNPGTGRKKHYAESAMHYARILNVMANIGLEISKARTGHFRDQVDKFLEVIPSLQEYKEKGLFYYISIIYGPNYGLKGMSIMSVIHDVQLMLDGEPKRLSLNTRPEVGPDTEIAIVINLTQIFT